MFGLGRWGTALAALVLVMVWLLVEKNSATTDRVVRTADSDELSQGQRKPTQKLKERVFSEVPTNKIESDSHRIKDYQQARKLFWQSLYPKHGVTLYCGHKFSSNFDKGVNVEHVFPMSWVTNGLRCGTRKQCRARNNTFNKIEADLHNLYPALSEVNQARGSLAYGEISGEKRIFSSSCDFETDDRRRIAEPRESVRGDIARAMFYMAHQYKQHGLVLFNKQQKLLLAWHRADPPNDEEFERNNKIERIQGNRNRFVDKPESLQTLVANGFFNSGR